MADRHLPNARRPWQFFRNDRLIDDIDAEECRRRYRFTPDNIDRLLGLVGHRLQRQTRRIYKLKRCSNKECCKQCRYVMFKGTMTKPCLDIATMSLPGSKVLCHRSIPSDCRRFCRRRHCHGVKGGYASDRLPLRLKRPSNSIPDDQPTQAIDEGRFSCHCRFSICNFRRRRHTYSYHCTAQLWRKLCESGALS